MAASARDREIGQSQPLNAKTGAATQADALAVCFLRAGSGPGRQAKRQRSSLVGLALRPEPRPKPEGHQRALAREAMSLGEQSSDLQGQLSV